MAFTILKEAQASTAAHFQTPCLFYIPGILTGDGRRKTETWTGAESPHLRVSTTGTGGYVSTPRSYLRLEGAEISYVVDGDWVRKMGLSNFRLTLSGNNLFLWSKMYEDLDFNGPSTTDGRLTYPVLKRYTFGISLNFR